MLVTILQPAFIPYLGYINMICLSDIFIFYDDVLFFRWFVNRNLIKGNKWLTIPVKSHRILIKDTEIADQIWKKRHLKLLHHAYARYPFYEETMPLVNKIYEHECSLSEFAIASVKEICKHLGIEKIFKKSSELGIENPNPTQRLVDICLSLKAGKYLTGKRSRNYIEQDRFYNNGIELYIHDYKPGLSIVDTLMTIGKEKTRELIPDATAIFRY